MTDIALTLPFWILGVGGVLLMLVEAFSKQKWPRAVFASVVLVLTIFAALKTHSGYFTGQTVFEGTVAVDEFALFFIILISVGALFTVLLGSDSIERSGIESPGELYALLLMSTAGAIVFANSAELITMFIGLEIMSMALYCLCGSALMRKDSTESAMKYFLLGSFSSAFMLYGIALLYGLTGSTYITEIAQKLPHLSGPVLSIAVGLVLIGFAFKIGLAPFHFWVPDVYQGAPTIITAFMACVIKASAIAAALRVLWVVMPDLLPMWSGVVWLFSVLTIVAGNLLALRQNNVKRMLAYSSIAHAGYIMAAFLAPSTQFGGGPAVLFYLISYTAMTLGAFGVLLALGDGRSNNDDLLHLQGLSSRHPFLAALMALFMLSLAGLPPGLAGLVGKFYVFSAVIKAGYIGLAIIAMCASTVSCYYYLRVIVAMYFMEQGVPNSLSNRNKVRDSALVFCGAACILLGLFPSFVVSIVQRAMW